MENILFFSCSNCCAEAKEKDLEHIHALLIMKRSSVLNKNAEFFSLIENVINWFDNHRRCAAIRTAWFAVGKEFFFQRCHEIITKLSDEWIISRTIILNSLQERNLKIKSLYVGRNATNKAMSLTNYKGLRFVFLFATRNSKIERPWVVIYYNVHIIIQTWIECIQEQKNKMCLTRE